MPIKISGSTEDLLINLIKKIDQIATQLNTIEEKLDKITETTTNKPDENSEVEIEEQSDLDEDYLTPTDLLFEKNVISLSGTTLINFRIATASEIAKVTNRDRAVESLYLNDLWNRNKIRKLRIGRKTYFYIGRLSEIKPFRNAIIKPTWRDALISVIREIISFSSDKSIKLDKIVKNYVALIQSDSAADLSSQTEMNRLEKNIRDIINDIAENTSFLKIEPKSQKAVFTVEEWLKLGL